MTATPLVLAVRRRDWIALSPWLVSGLLFVILFAQPAATLVRDWWRDPEAGHGLLLGPLALILAWRRGRLPDARPDPVLGLILLTAAVALRYLSGLAAELFTMRLSLVAAAGALVVCGLGLRQLLHWWLPFALIVLSIPLPAVLIGSLALPLQFQASTLGAALLESRHVPVQLAGNIIHLPGRSLFVTEACSGLRSLTALLAIGVLVGGLWHRAAWSRVALVAAAIPVAILLNGLRVFLTGYLAYWVNPALADGFLHYSEGWMVFVVAFGVLVAISSVLRLLERRARSAA